MKKLLSWVITITLLLSLTPALPVSAADAYAVLGVQDGERIILNPQVEQYTTFQHKVTIVDANQVSTKLLVAGHLTNAVNFTLEPTATGIDSVVFAIDGNVVATDTEYPYELVLGSEHAGQHRLTATINKTGGGTEEKIINFEGIIGLSHDSRTVNYNSGVLDETNTPTFNGVISRGETIENGAIKLTDGNGISTFWLQPDVKTNEMQLGDTKLFYIDYDVKKTADGVSFANMPSRSFRVSNQGTPGYVMTALPANEWAHITVVADYERGWMTGYINGVQFKSYAQSTILASTSNLVTDGIAPIFNGGALYIDNYAIRTYDKVVPADFVSSSIEDGAEKVSERVAAIRVTGTRAPKSVDVNGVTIQAGDSTLTMGVDYDVTFEGNDLVIKPKHYLALDTVHTISVTGVRDVYGCKFNEFPSFSFKTRQETDNLKPEVTISANERYDRGETITLTAFAKDDISTNDVNGGTGAITYVEFLADGVVIEGSRMTESSGDNLYTFDWTDAPERLEAYTITARACDNNDDITVSEPVYVQVFSPRYPEVSLNVPEKINGKILGVSSGSILVNASATDIDGTITNAELRLFNPSGEQIGDAVSITENFDSIAYPFTEGLDEKGTYKVQLSATDNNSSYYGDDLTTVTEAFVYVSHMSKAYPAVLTEDLTDPSNLSKWSLDGTAEKTIDENGLTIKQTESGTATASRTTFQLVSGKVTVADMVVKFSDNNHERIVAFDGISQRLETSFTLAVTFDANGKILFDGVEKGSYEKDKEYNISALLDLVSGKNILFINGSKVGEVAASTTSVNVTLKLGISQTIEEGTSSFSLLEYGVYKLTEGVDPSTLTLTLKDGGELITGTSFVGISQYPEYIAVSANGAIDEASIKKGLLLVGPDGKPCATNFANGKLYINEKLVAGTDYTLRITTDIQVGDASLAETTEYTVSIQAKENDSVNVAETGFAQVALAPDTTSVNFATEISGAGSTVVCIVYVGNTMKRMICEENQTGAVNLSVNLSEIFAGEIPANAYVEAFVIKDFTDMAPVSDIIYRID